MQWFLHSHATTTQILNHRGNSPPLPAMCLLYGVNDEVFSVSSYVCLANLLWKAILSYFWSRLMLMEYLLALFHRRLEHVKTGSFTSLFLCGILYYIIIMILNWQYDWQFFVLLKLLTLTRRCSTSCAALKLQRFYHSFNLIFLRSIYCLNAFIFLSKAGLVWR